jgi:hypothetical protein
MNRRLIGSFSTHERCSVSTRRPRGRGLGRQDGGLGQGSGNDPRAADVGFLLNEDHRDDQELDSTTAAHRRGACRPRRRGSDARTSAPRKCRIDVQREGPIGPWLGTASIELDPGYDKPHFQLISARAGLQEPERAVAVYEGRLAAAPDSVREHRFLAQAYLSAHAYRRAHELTQAGLALAPDDGVLFAARGEARAGLGDVQGALSDWQRALRLDGADIGALYSTAFLLEREGRLDESIQAWQAIVAWNEARGLTLERGWPKRELDRLHHLTTGSS